MLDSLDIKNYRNLKDLQIRSLGRINLITGKNNTGKSSILEALAVYASKVDLNLINQLLNDRGETYRQLEVNKNTIEANIKSLSSLFTHRVVGFHKDDAVSIGSINNTLFGEQSSIEKSIRFRFVRYLDELQRDSQGSLLSRKRTVIEEDVEKQNSSFKIGLEIRSVGSVTIIPLDEDRHWRTTVYRILNKNENYQYIRTRNIDRDVNGKLWDNIALTEKEQFVIDALKIIEPATDRLAFIEENGRERTAVIKLSNQHNILPLRSMGDGINRILTIILALVNADNGFLLIDEFENGLHYTVQEQLWNIIFRISQKLNVQIFVTTHSEDCIKAFENILNNHSASSEGKLIRLDNIMGNIKQVEFDINELRIANDNDIEIR